MKEFKKNKYTLIVFFMFLGLFILGGLVFNIVMPSNDDSKKYGNRLDDIKKAGLEMTKSDKQKLEKAVEGVEYVVSSSTSIENRIINVIVVVKENTTIKQAKALDKTVLDAINDKQEALYDVQLLIKNEKDEVKGFPMIGYKNSSDKVFAF